MENAVILLLVVACIASTRMDKQRMKTKMNFKGGDHSREVV